MEPSIFSYRIQVKPQEQGRIQRSFAKAIVFSHNVYRFASDCLKRHSLLILLCVFLPGCAVAPPVPTAGVGGGTSATGPMTLSKFIGADLFAAGARRVIYRSRIRASGWVPALAPIPPSAAPMAIGDPACLVSPSPAVAAAAEIQQAEATAPAKIKAVSYLASLQNCSNPKVEEAILAALDDASTSVRAGTIQALLENLNHCGSCHGGCGGCCTPAISRKLYKLAYESDQNGCWLEPDPRVRRLARLASCQCPPASGEPISLAPEELPPPELIELSKQI